MPAAVRLHLTGCVLLALFLAGCGGGGSDPTGSPTAASRKPATVGEKPRQQAEKRAKAAQRDSCQDQLGSFVASMVSLRRRLAVGLTYDQYVDEVRGIRSTYAKIPIDRVAIGCLATVGTPGEQAFNRYVEAANDWGECVSEAGCSSSTVEPVLQRRWRIASHFLTGADEGLSASAP